MKKSTFTYKDIELQYIFVPAAQGSDNKNFVVVISNPMQKDGTADFLFSLSKYKNVPKLFVVSSRPYKFGMFLMRNKEPVLQEAVEALVDQHRTNLGVEPKDTWLIGFCAATYALLQIAVKHGYNALFTEYGFKGNIGYVWDENDPEFKAYYQRWKTDRSANIDFDPDGGFLIGLKEYSGYGFEISSFTGKYLEEVHAEAPEKLAAPRMFMLASIDEESWKLQGDYTVKKLFELGCNLELTLRRGWDHMGAVPIFVEWFNRKLETLKVLA